MRFLIDNALSPILAEGLRSAGHEAAHIRDYGMQSATDDAVLAKAAAENRILVSADADFGTILVVSQTTGPSAILFRRAPRKPGEQLNLLLANLPAIAESLAKGSIVVMNGRGSAYGTFQFPAPELANKMSLSNASNAFPAASMQGLPY